MTQLVTLLLALALGPAPDAPTSAGQPTGDEPKADPDPSDTQGAEPGTGQGTEQVTGSSEGTTDTASTEPNATATEPNEAVPDPNPATPDPTPATPDPNATSAGSPDVLPPDDGATTAVPAEPSDGTPTTDVGPEDAKGKDEKKGKNKKLSWSIGGRIMGGWQVERERPVDMPAETKQKPFLRQARVKLRLDYKKRFKIRTSLDFADALRAPNFDRVSYLRNAYGLVRFHDAARLQFGYFKRPFSRLELRGPGDLPFRGRGLANDHIIEDRNYGDRSVGTMMWGKIDRARLSWYAGAFAPALRTKGVDAIGRLQADPLKWLSIGANGGYKRVENGIGEMVDVGSFGADFRVKFKGLYVLGDLVMGQDYLVPGEPFSLGLVGYASYDIDLPKKLILQPVVLTEWADANVEVSQNDAIRSVLGVNLLWRKRFRVMPQVELIRPRGVIDNPWTSQETYYVMLSLEL